MLGKLRVGEYVLAHGERDVVVDGLLRPLGLFRVVHTDDAGLGQSQHANQSASRRFIVREALALITALNEVVLGQVLVIMEHVHRDGSQDAVQVSP